jgi:hypothetical protein
MVRTPPRKPWKQYRSLLVLLLTNFLFQSNHSKKTSPGSWHEHHRASFSSSSHRLYHPTCSKGNCTHGQSTLHHHLHGPHAAFYHDGRIMSGRGIHNISHNHYYRGHFQNNTYHGLGVMHRGRTTYHGRYHKGVLSGPVTTTLRNGTVWRSHFHNSIPWSGKTRWPWCIDDTRIDCLDHGVYLGHWWMGKPNGFGIFINGTVRYEGGFIDGTFTGHGILMIENQYRYDGYFQMGEKHGNGVMYDLHKHVKFWGEFRENEKHGIGFTRWPGFLYGFNVRKNMWRNGIQKIDLPHSEL